MRGIWLLGGLLALAASVLAADRTSRASRPPAPPEAQQIGEVIFNRKTREIRFPAAVNMAGGELLEFAIVHANGKVHEALLISSLIVHAERHHGEQEIVSRRVEGDKLCIREAAFKLHITAPQSR